MKDELVSFKVAKLAKEKGFNYAYEFYDKDGELEEFGMVGGWSSSTNENYPSPTQSLLQKWLREKHNIHIHLEYIGGGSYYVESTNFDSEVNIFMDNLYGTYEDILNIILEISIETIN